MDDGHAKRLFKYPVGNDPAASLALPRPRSSRLCPLTLHAQDLLARAIRVRPTCSGQLTRTGLCGHPRSLASGPLPRLVYAPMPGNDLVVRARSNRRPSGWADRCLAIGSLPPATRPGAVRGPDVDHACPRPPMCPAPHAWAHTASRAVVHRPRHIHARCSRGSLAVTPRVPGLCAIPSGPPRPRVLSRILGRLSQGCPRSDRLGQARTALPMIGCAGCSRLAQLGSSYAIIR
jgi:hypothetical protein